MRENVHFDSIQFVYLCHSQDSVAQMVKNPPAMQDTQVRSLGRKAPLEKGMATHSSILAWRVHPMDRGAWRAIVHGAAQSQTRRKNSHFHFHHLRLSHVAIRNPSTIIPNM